MTTFNLCGKAPKSDSSKLIWELVIDKSSCWRFFYGAFQGSNQLCGLGGIIYFSDNHYLTFKATIGWGTNNLTELFTLKPLLKKVSNSGIKELQVLDDSMLVVKWMQGSQLIYNINMMVLTMHLKEIVAAFEKFTVDHIYCELN